MFQVSTASCFSLILSHYSLLLLQPVVEEELRQRPAAETWAKLNLENPLHCPHDMSYQLDYRDDLPTLLKPSKEMYKLS